MKRSIHFLALLAALWVSEIYLVTTPLYAVDPATAAAQILDASKSNSEREAVIAANAGQSGEIIAAMVKDLQAGTPEEYKRIPWIWRVAIAAAKRNNSAELKSLFQASVPKANDPLLDWQAVVLGGGIINGLTLVDVWPGNRVEEVFRGDKDFKLRWQRTIELAAIMADNEKVPNGTRYDALRIIGVDTWERRGEQLTKYLAKGINGELQQGAVSALVDMESKNVGPALISGLGCFSENNRKFALDGLLRNDTRIAALLDGLEAKKVDVALLGAERIKKLRNLQNKKLRARVDKLFPIVRAQEKGGATYSVGVAKIDVTPDYPVLLSGYLGRATLGESKGVLQRIYAKALAIGSDEEGPAIIITVDNCMVPEYLRDEVRRRLASKGIISEKFAVCSSHTHTAPKLAGILNNIFGRDIVPDQQANIDRYTAELTDKMEQVALAALKDRKPSKLAWGQGKATFAANRRTAGGPVDHDVPVLKVTGKDGKIRALLINYACHCTTIAHDLNTICGDWAGYAQEYLEEEFPGAIALTAIGCGADSNPSPRTAPGVDFAKQHGQAITTSVNDRLTQPLTPLSAKLECRAHHILLPFDKHPTRAEFEERAKKNDPPGYHARKQLARLDRGEPLQTELSYFVQTWNFGNELALVFLPGEVVVDYSLRLKKEFDRTRLWVNAYANDVPCYVPSKRIWTEGGYEGGGAMIYYDRPTRLAENTEELIIKAVHDLMPPDFVFDPKKAESPQAKSPDQALATIRTKPGLEVDLVATEPLIASPVAIDFATDGKLWVMEMYDYPTGLHGNYEPGGRVKYLEDKNGDGIYDKSTLFLDGLPFPTGLMQWRKGVLVCAAPDILYAEDTDGDGKADEVKKLFTGFVTHNYQARVNSLRWGLDNWVYAAAGIFGGKIKSEITGKVVECSNRDLRFNPDTGELEPASGASQQGRVRDDFGNWFGCDNSTFIWHYPLPDFYLRRNPYVTALEPRVNPLKYGDSTVLFPVSRTLERFNNPNSANRTTSAAGIEIYRDDFLGKDFYGNAFIGETVHNLVQRIVLTHSGATFEGHRAEDEQRSSFFASTDNWCRPVQMRTGPDGALWIIDMYRFVIEHPRWIPADRLATLDVRAGADSGRIFRVYPTGKKLRPIYNLTTTSTAKLVSLLDTPNGTQRDLIHRELFQRQDKSAIKPLKDLAARSQTPAVRAQALCALDGLKATDVDLLQLAMTDSHPGVRQQAVRLSEPFFHSKDSDWTKEETFRRDELAAMLGKLANDPDFKVRYQVALSLGEWNDPRAAQMLGELASQNISDSWMRAAVLSSASNFPGEILKAVLTLPEKTAGRAEIVGQLIATAAGADHPQVFEAVLAAIAPQDHNVPSWQLSALASLQEALARKKLSLDNYANSSDTEVREAVLRIQTVIASAGAVAKNEKASVDEREAAIRLLTWAKDDGSLQTLIGFATQEGNAKLQKAALNALRLQQNPKVPQLLLAGWKQYLFSIRSDLLEILLSRDESIQKVLDAVEQGTVTVNEIPPVNRQQLLKHSNSKIQQRAIALFPQNQSRKEVMAKFSEVSKLTGHPEKGSEIFARLCANCHAFKGQGKAVGPDLMPLGDKSPDDFMLAILDPSSIVEPRFIQYNIELKDGRSLSGVVRAETATSLTLVSGGGVTEKILRSDMQDIRPSSLSLMPEGLEEGMTSQDFADLIAYLKLRPAGFGSATPEQAASAKKKFVSGGVNGVSRIVAADETTDYPSWLGSLPMAHCRQSTGKSKLVWQTTPAPSDLKADADYVFRLPAAMGLLSEPSGKFQLKINDKPVTDFNVTLTDGVWNSRDGKVSMRYQVMESNTEDSNGILTISVKAELLEAGKPVTFEVDGSATNSQRWFGVYVLADNKTVKR